MILFSREFELFFLVLGFLQGPVLSSMDVLRCHTNPLLSRSSGSHDLVKIVAVFAIASDLALLEDSYGSREFGLFFLVLGFLQKPSPSCIEVDGGSSSKMIVLL